MNVWEKAFRQGEHLDIRPHPEIGKIADFFAKENIARILDLGSGGGRHVIYLSRKGFDVYGLDSAPSGLAHSLIALAKEGLTASVTLHDMSSLPYDAGYFDAVISTQVIHHDKLDGIKRTVDEIRRVLKAGGFVWITLPVSKNEPSSKHVEIEPDTYLPLNGLEKGLPHHYFKMEEIPLLFSGFSVIDLHVDSFNHFSFLAQAPLK